MSATKPDLRNGRRHRSPVSDAFKVDRLPPHSLEAEQGVLGCVLSSPNPCLAEAMELLHGDAEAFYDLRHKRVWEAMVAMVERGEPVDLITLQQKLRDSEPGGLNLAGGLAYLASLQDGVPSTANLSHYATLVFEKRLLRRMIAACTDAVGRIYECDGEADAMLDRIERDVLAVREARTRKGAVGVAEVVKEAVAQIETAYNAEGSVTGLSTGLVDLDRAVDGLHPGETTLLAAFPSVGKTSLAMNVAEHVLLGLHLPVAVFSLEMTAVDLVKRFMASHGRVNLRNVRKGFLMERDFPRLIEAAGKVGRSALHIDDTAGLSVFEVRARARRLWQRHGVKLVVVDYLQLMTAADGKRRQESRHEEIAAISSNMKAMAKELNVPVLCLSQLTKLQGGGLRLRGSDDIEQDADNVWILERKKGAENDADNQEAEPITLWVRKQRNGPRDVPVHLTFLKQFTRFECTAKVTEADAPEERGGRWDERS